MTTTAEGAGAPQSLTAAWRYLLPSTYVQHIPVLTSQRLLLNVVILAVTYGSRKLVLFSWSHRRAPAQVRTLAHALPEDQVELLCGSGLHWLPTRLPPRSLILLLSAPCLAMARGLRAHIESGDSVTSSPTF